MPSNSNSPKSWPDAPESLGGAATPALHLRPDLVIAGKYRLLRPAGQGGMGTVWVARNEATGAEVALKVLLADKVQTEEISARFRREAYAAAQLAHRGIVRVFDLVEMDPPHEGSLVMVMELLRGETLASRMNHQHVFTVQETVNIISPLLSALAHAHRAGIIHRDLKPENVYLAVDPDGHVTPKILDFGISKITNVEVPSITGDGATLGTPSYMSPEQARGAPDIDARSDVFAVGIVLYEMLSGENPFFGPSYHSVVASILERDPKPIPNLSEPIAAVLKKALAKRAEDRYASAADLAVALRQAANDTGVAFDVDKSITPMPWDVAVRAQAAAVGAPAGVVDALTSPAGADALAAEVPVSLPPMGLNDPTEISLRTRERRRKKRRSRIGFVFAALIFVSSAVGGFALWRLTRGVSPPVVPAAASPEAPPPTVQVTAVQGAQPAAPLSAPVPVTATVASPVAPTTTTTTTTVAPSPIPSATTLVASSTSTARAHPPPRGGAKKQPESKPQTGVIKDPGF